MDIQKIREEFPILNQQVNGKPLIYFDNAATNQKPKRVIDALSTYYEKYNANIHRGIHTLAEKATRAYEDTRLAMQEFIHAKHVEEIIFTRGVTESVNLVASSYGRAFLKEGDEIILSGLEHHSNIVPWQMIAEEKKAVIKVITITSSGEIDIDHYRQLLSSRTKIVAVNHASNSLGTINPIKEMITMAHEVGAVVLIDGAQASAHLAIDVIDLGCDFYCISSHKMYGPTGTGILYGKKELLEKMPPYMGGGEMIKDVTFARTTYNELPYKFEAGTPNIADVVALKEAVGFINQLGKENIASHEYELLSYATQKLASLSSVRMIGTASKKVSVQSFVIEGIHPFDIGQMLDARGIAVRTGHHCTQPLMDSLGLEGTVRASFAVYNTKEEIDVLIDGLKRIIKFLN
ncbi:MAG: cysteine desulfurase [Cytophagales bacterium]|nr:cysteine desulfurase [Cytophagales bacterium]MCA6367373.1 cysteine desulfurase [Cytophagales bacterium]MCA6371730.1 cysteine desulfurase [Cytophagales bacterium]MCA6376142.1 cysteine desulfurase [Cytophagales bacterium]MCA6383962.1 cysteine desulfurase [Cytophagales bacterium]